MTPAQSTIRQNLHELESELEAQERLAELRERLVVQVWDEVPEGAVGLFGEGI